MVDLTKLLPKLVSANPELAAKIAWSRAAGEGLRHHAVPTSLNGKRLTVSVADALWRKQLESMAAELLFRINNLLGSKGVEEIVFRISPTDLAAANSKRSDQQPAARSAPVLPTELLFAAGAIADEDLRAQFLRAADNLIARRDANTSE